MDPAQFQDQLNTLQNVAQSLCQHRDDLSSEQRDQIAGMFASLYREWVEAGLPWIRHGADWMTIFQQLSEAVLIYGQDGVVVLANQAVVNAYGFDPIGFRLEELLARMKFTHLDGRPYKINEISTYRALRNEIISDEQVTFTRLNGLRMVVSVSATPIQSSAGEPDGAVVVWRDITAQVSAMKEVEAQRSRLDTILQQLPCGVILAEALTGKVILRNAQANAIWPTTEALMEPAGSLFALKGFHVDGRPLAPEEWPLDRSIHSGEVVQGEEIQFQKGDGSLGAMLVSSCPIIEDEHITAAVMVFQDISQIKETEDALRKSEERLLLTAQAAEVGLWNWDLKANRLTWDNRAQAVFGLEEGSEISFERFMNLVHPGDRQRVEANLADTLNGREILNNEYRVIWPDGSLHWINSRGRTVFAEDGEILGMMGVVLDMTRRVKAQEEVSTSISRVEVQRRLLQQREYERLQIARDLHDGPMQELIALTFAVQSLIEKIPQDEGKRALKDLRTGLQRQINELRSYAGELRPPSLIKFGVKPAIDSHLDQFRKKHPEIEVQARIEPLNDRLEESTRVAIFRVYQELMNNVVRHSQASQVYVYLSRSQDKIELEIRDNGHGFQTPQDWVGLARQGHLGLVGIMERVEAIGGGVVITSEPGQGTGVKIVIPR